MGTRRSRHNKGRKPFYKEHRRNLMFAEASDAPTVEQAAQMLVERPAYGGIWLNRNLGWDDTQECHVRLLAAAGADLDKAADAAGRTQYAVVNRAMELGFEIPEHWRRLIRPLRGSGPREPLLSYPYIRKARPEHDDLLRAYSLVPHRMPEWIKADVTQSMMLALYDGTIGLEALERNRDNVSWFIKKFYKEQMPYQEISLENNDDDRDNYELAAASAAEEYAWTELNDSRHAHDRLRTHVAPTQEAAADIMLMRERQQAWHEKELFLSPDEVETIYYRRDGKAWDSRTAERLSEMVSRQDLFQQQNGKCAYCKCDMTVRWGFPNTVTRDHIVPVSAGGSDDDSNIVGACMICNNRKGSLPVQDFLDTLKRGLTK